MVLSGKVAEQAMQHRAAAVFIDEGGIGAGVVDRVRQMLPGRLVVGVNFGGRADRYTLGDGMPLHRQQGGRDLGVDARLAEDRRDPRRS